MNATSCAANLTRLVPRTALVGVLGLLVVVVVTTLSILSVEAILSTP